MVPLIVCLGHEGNFQSKSGVTRVLLGTDLKIKITSLVQYEMVSNIVGIKGVVLFATIRTDHDRIDLFSGPNIYHFSGPISFTTGL